MNLNALLATTRRRLSMKWSPRICSAKELKIGLSSGHDARCSEESYLFDFSDNVRDVGFDPGGRAVLACSGTPRFPVARIREDPVAAVQEAPRFEAVCGETPDATPEPEEWIWKFMVSHLDASQDVSSRIVKRKTLKKDFCVVVTAAGSGLGAACAREIASRHYKVVLMSRSEAAIQLATELGGCGLQGSVTDAGDLRRLVDLAISSYGAIDVVVVNAGHAPWMTDPNGHRFDPNVKAHLLDIPDEDRHSTLDLYFLHTVRMARLVTPIFEKQGGGSIVNISAIGANEPYLANPPSSVIRPTLAAFRKLYADRHGRVGIRMNDVILGCLGNRESTDGLIRTIPAGRPGTLGEIAKVVAFLLSEDAAYITGQGILVDVGFNRTA